MPPSPDRYAAMRAIITRLVADDIARSRGHVKLTVLTEVDQRRFLRPVGAPIVIGRHESAGITIEDDSVSRRHAVLHLGPTLRLEDLGSHNGTFLRGRRILPKVRVPIEPGEPFEIGSVVCVVHCDPHLAA